MGQIFKRRSNAIVRSAFSLAVLAPIAVFLFYTELKWSPWQTEVREVQDQPVPFSHRHHAGELGIDCRYCHTSVEKTATAGLPPTHTCMTCHSQIWQNAEMLEPVRKSYAENKPLEWNRLYRLPQYVYFDHSIHIAKGVDCASCHGAVDTMPLTWKVRPFYMRECLACHREPGKHFTLKEPVSTERLSDCSTCHR